jgi:alkanesulfonate monooxygenase SsuD/methylene tetrahydromethanopterin reductase-like flavin-dependent oxidoreductase (luciferase family)
LNSRPPVPQTGVRPVSARQSQFGIGRIELQIEHDDRLSFDTVLLAELHFVPEFSDMFSPLTVAAAAAERTKRARSCIAASREMLNALEGLSLATNKSGSRRSFG